MTFYTGTYLNKAEEGWSVNWEKMVLCQLFPDSFLCMGG